MRGRIQLSGLIPLAAVALLLSQPCRGQCLEWQSGFGPHGASDTISALTVFDDGSGPVLYAAGGFTAIGGVPASRVAKWDGAGWSEVGGGTNGHVFSLAVADLGSGPALYAGGMFTSAGGVSANRVAKWDGSSWSSLGVGTNGNVFALTAFTDGPGLALYAGGQFTTAGGAAASRVAKWNGSSWAPLGPGVNGTVLSLAVLGTTLCVGGGFTMAGGNPALQIARWNGASWSAFGLGLGTGNNVYVMSVFDDGTGAKLYAGGGFTKSGSTTVKGIARWDGAAWTPVGGGFDPYPNLSALVHSLHALDLGSGPALYAGGYFGFSGGQALNSIARWDGTNWQPLGSGVDESGVANGFHGVVGALADFDFGGGPALCAGGTFSGAGGSPAHNLARWDGASWSSTVSGNGSPDYIQALAVFDDGGGDALYAGGRFVQAGGVFASKVAKWNGTSWAPLGTGMYAAQNPSVDALAVFDDGSGAALYAGGEFTQAGDALAENVARWDGTSWSALGSGVNGEVRALAVFDDGPGGSGPALYAAGAFSVAGGTSASFIAKWNGTTWSRLGSGLSSAAQALAVFDDGSGPVLCVGGYFETAGGVSATCVARWNGSTWSAFPSSLVNPGKFKGVFALASFDDGSGPALYAGGNFDTLSAVADGIAKWNGTNWVDIGGVNAQYGVQALQVFDDGTGSALYAGGDFTLAGGVGANRIARWNGAAWSALGSGIGEVAGAAPGGVSSLAVFDDGSDGAADLYAGGNFATAGGVACWHIAEWRGCPTAAAPYCFGDGTRAACPCANSGTAGRGCDNSAATGGALLTAAGVASLAADTLQLTSSGELPSALSIVLQGSASISAVHFGDGLRCVGGVLKRLYSQNAVGGVVIVPQPGDPTISARSAALGDAIAPGASRFYQTYYRDPNLAFCAAPVGNSWNVSSGVSVSWLP